MIEPLHIIIDEQEKRPWAWEPHMATTTIRSLVAGDYALSSDCEEVKGRKKLAVRFAIERKSLDDFLGTISTGWERFLRELTRMESFPARVVIVEGDFESVCFCNRDNGADGLEPPRHNHAQLTPAFVARRVAELTMQGVTVLFAGDAAMAAGLAYRVFIRRQEKMNNGLEA